VNSLSAIKRKIRVVSEEEVTLVNKGVAMEMREIKKNSNNTKTLAQMKMK